MNDELYLEIPAEKHESEYIRMIDRWEAMEDNIQPELIRRNGTPYGKFLEWCADDRATGSMLSTKTPCTLFFLTDASGEIYGGIVMNHANTHRGHLHAGIAPWNRGRGMGTKMLELALQKCREMGFDYVEIVPHKGNDRAVATVIKNGGILTEEFCDNDVWSQRYRIDF